jgi:succinoglycan biosynthesis transport protein ExoP
MGKYYEVLKRNRDESSPSANCDSKLKGSRATPAAREPILLPIVQDVAATVARGRSIQTLGERIAPLAVLSSSLRILVSGCRPGDGASTVAAALAIDLSQRLGLATLLVDAHLRHPSLHRVFSRADNASPAPATAEGLLRLQPTGWARLELASCDLRDGEPEHTEFLDRFEVLAKDYRSVVVDLGVVRMDPRLLSLARLGDPLLLVVRYGHTERQELANTCTGLRAAQRPPAGVILNGVANPMPLRRFLKR